MATRKHYSIRLTDEAGAEIEAPGTRFAMNSGIRESEAMARRLARSEETYYRGERPQREGDVYTRVWVSELGRVVTATVSLSS